jgi:hypothetical protein
MRQNPPALDVHYRRQIHKAFCHANVGRVQQPDLIAAINRQFAQQVGTYLVLQVALAGIGLRHQRGDAHLAHQRVTCSRPTV